MESRVCVYLNRHASHGSNKYLIEEIKRQLFRSELVFRTPVSLEELKKSLEFDLKDNVLDAIVSVGGDGTVNTLIQHIVGSQVKLLVLPAGTANDFAQEIGHNRSIRKVIGAVRAGDTKRVDVIKINERYMVTNGGIGLAGDIAESINQMRKEYPAFKFLMKLLGKNIYTSVLGLNLCSPNLKYYHLYLESPKFTGEVSAPFVMVNNQSKIAGSFEVAPYTKNNDGKFNVTILKHQDRMGLVKCLYKIFSGEMDYNDADLISFETNELKITNLSQDHEVAFFGDGEILTKTNKFEISILSEALNIVQFDKHNISRSYQLDAGDTI